MKIQVEIKRAYGRDMIYPVDDNAKRFATISGNKTLSEHEITLIKELGFTVELVVHNPFETEVTKKGK